MISGKRILIVEDEPLVAMMLEDMLDELGASVVGPAGNIRMALDLLDSEVIDGAVLDVNLGQERSDAVADRLLADGTPFIYATGYGRESLSARDVRVIAKPYRIDQLQDALRQALS